MAEQWRHDDDNLSANNAEDRRANPAASISFHVLTCANAEQVADVLRNRREPCIGRFEVDLCYFT